MDKFWGDLAQRLAEAAEKMQSMTDYEEHYTAMWNAATERERTAEAYSKMLRVLIPVVEGIALGRIDDPRQACCDALNEEVVLEHRGKSPSWERRVPLLP